MFLNSYLHYNDVSSDDSSKSKTLNTRSYHTEVLPVLKNICDLEDKRKSLKKHRRLFYLHSLHIKIFKLIFAIRMV